MRAERFRALAWATIALTLAVIAWGAFVRATGSGAGCGSHWPTCNGEIVHRPKSVATAIELTHRLTSGISFLTVVGLLVAAFRTFPRRHLVRTGAALSMFFMVTEAAVGAGLVLFEMVAENKSAARALWMAAHLINTFFLLASLALTLWWAHDRPRPVLRGLRALPVFGALVGLLLVGTTGAIVALGDTLFPARSLAEGIAQDLAPGAHFLIRLRALHPALAIGVGAAVTVWARRIAAGTADRSTVRLANAAIVLYATQISVGFLDLVLLAPVALQLVHLVVADVYWIVVVVLAAAHLEGATEPVTAPVAIASRA